MVKITNGVNVFEVTNGAFDEIYSRQGYTVMDEEVSGNEAAEAEVASVPEKSDDEIFVEEILEKPISQWSKDEVKHFAGIKGIDITDTKSANEAKDIIKSFIDGEEIRGELMTDIERIKKEIREAQSPYFEEDDFQYYLDKNDGNLNATIYEMLIIKSEDSTISVSGLSTQDTSAYFKRLASRFKPFNSGILSEE